MNTEKLKTNESIEEIKRKAGEKAISEGFDQVIFRTRRGKFDYRRSSESRTMKPGRIICYIRLFYKDGVLEPRICKA